MQKTKPVQRCGWCKWVGPNGALLEMVGLPREGVKHSAVARRDCASSTVRTADVRRNVRAFEGVAELRDRRGGSALVVAPGKRCTC